jgi:hypothetical protein
MAKNKAGTEDKLNKVGGNANNAGDAWNRPDNRRFASWYRAGMLGGDVNESYANWCRKLLAGQASDAMEEWHAKMLRKGLVKAGWTGGDPYKVFDEWRRERERLESSTHQR